MILQVLVLVASAVATYAIIHEVAHYTVARIVGCKARIGFDTDGFLISPATIIDNCPEKYHSLILYAPYLVNTLLVIFSIILSDNIYILELGVIAMVTFANMPLEKEENRNLLKNYSRKLVERILYRTPLIAGKS